jgi:hypothetical protein
MGTRRLQQQEHKGKQTTAMALRTGGNGMLTAVGMEATAWTPTTAGALYSNSRDARILEALAAEGK